MELFLIASFLFLAGTFAWPFPLNMAPLAAAVLFLLLTYDTRDR